MGGGMGGMGGGMGGMGGGSVGQGAGSGRALGSAPESMLRGRSNSGMDAAESNAPSNSIAGLPSSGKEAVDLAERVAELKTGVRAEASTSERTVDGRQFRKVGEAWIDQTFKSSMPILRVRLLGKAYFQLLAEHPELGAIFALGIRVTWVSPSGTALIVDKQGQDKPADAVLKRLFEVPAGRSSKSPKGTAGSSS